MQNALSIHNISLLKESNPYFIQKDLDSVYTDCSMRYAKLAGFDHPEALKGINDGELPCDAADHADEWIKQDLQVIREQVSFQCIEVHPYDNDEWFSFMTTKQPIYDQSQVIGTLWTGISLNIINLVNIFFIRSLAHKNMKINQLSNSITIGTKNMMITLSNQQEVVLFYLLRGLSVKSIARYLELSPRTIDTHLDAIKQKFKCFNKQTLIEKAFTYGYLDFIPIDIIRANRSMIIS